MSGSHGHRPSGALGGSRRGFIKPLLLVFGLNLGYSVIELIGGLWTQSLALVADAGHMFVDVVAVGLSLFACWLADKPATKDKSYGYYRVEILVAFINGIILWGLVLFIWYEAARRLAHVTEVDAVPMLVVAVIGLMINMVSAWVLASSQRDNLNVRGAFLHVLLDMFGSIGVVTAGVIMLSTGWYVVDPLLSVGLSILILWSATKLIKESVNILMEGSPGHVNVSQVREELLAIEGVRNVHDLHVWTLASGIDAMSGHAVIDGEGGRSQRVLEDAKAILKRRFSIDHITLQLETHDLSEHEPPI